MARAGGGMASSGLCFMRLFVIVLSIIVMGAASIEATVLTPRDKMNYDKLSRNSVERSSRVTKPDNQETRTVLSAKKVVKRYVSSNLNDLSDRWLNQLTNGLIDEQQLNDLLGRYFLLPKTSSLERWSTRTDGTSSSCSKSSKTSPSSNDCDNQVPSVPTSTSTSSPSSPGQQVVEDNNSDVSNDSIELPKPYNLSVLLVSHYPPILELRWNLFEQLDLFDTDSWHRDVSLSANILNDDMIMNVNKNNKQNMVEFDREVLADAGKATDDNNEAKIIQIGTTSQKQRGEIEAEQERKRFIKSRIRNLLARKSLTCFQVMYHIVNSRFKILEEYPATLRNITMEWLLPATEYSLRVIAVYADKYRVQSDRVNFVTPSDEKSRRFREGTYRPIHRSPDERRELKIGLEQVRNEELTIVAIAIGFWLATIYWFFNKWGKIRMLEPYQPAYREASPPATAGFTTGPGSVTGNVVQQQQQQPQQQSSSAQPGQQICGLINSNSLHTLIGPSGFVGDDTNEAALCQNEICDPLMVSDEHNQQQKLLQQPLIQAQAQFNQSLQQHQHHLHHNHVHQHHLQHLDHQGTLSMNIKAQSLCSARSSAVNSPGLSEYHQQFDSSNRKLNFVQEPQETQANNTLTNPLGDGTNNNSNPNNANNNNSGQALPINQQQQQQQRRQSSNQRNLLMLGHQRFWTTSDEPVPGLESLYRQRQIQAVRARIGRADANESGSANYIFQRKAQALARATNMWGQRPLVTRSTTNSGSIISPTSATGTSALAQFKAAARRVGAGDELDLMTRSKLRDPALVSLVGGASIPSGLRLRRASKTPLQSQSQSQTGPSQSSVNASTSLFARLVNVAGHRTSSLGHRNNSTSPLGFAAIKRVLARSGTQGSDQTIISEDHESNNLLNSDKTSSTIQPPASASTSTSATTTTTTSTISTRITNQQNVLDPVSPEPILTAHENFQSNLEPKSENDNFVAKSDQSKEHSTTQTVSEMNQIKSGDACNMEGNKMRRLMFMNKTHQYHQVATSTSSSTLMRTTSSPTNSGTRINCATGTSFETANNINNSNSNSNNNNNNILIMNMNDHELCPSTSTSTSVYGRRCSQYQASNCELPNSPSTISLPIICSKTCPYRSSMSSSQHHTVNRSMGDESANNKQRHSERHGASFRVSRLRANQRIQIQPPSPTSIGLEGDDDEHDDNLNYKQRESQNEDQNNQFANISALERDQDQQHQLCPLVLSPYERNRNNDNLTSEAAAADRQICEQIICTKCGHESSPIPWTHSPVSDNEPDAFTKLALYQYNVRQSSIHQQRTCSVCSQLLNAELSLLQHQNDANFCLPSHPFNASPSGQRYSQDEFASTRLPVAVPGFAASSASLRPRVSSMFVPLSREQRDTYQLLHNMSQKKSKSSEDVAYLSSLILHIWTKPNQTNALLQNASSHTGLPDSSASGGTSRLRRCHLQRRSNDDQSANSANSSKRREVKSSLTVSQI